MTTTSPFYLALEEQAGSADELPKVQEDTTQKRHFKWEVQ